MLLLVSVAASYRIGRDMVGDVGVSNDQDTAFYQAFSINSADISLLPVPTLIITPDPISMESAESTAEETSCCAENAPALFNKGILSNCSTYNYYIELIPTDDALNDSFFNSN